MRAVLLTVLLVLAACTTTSESTPVSAPDRDPTGRDPLAVAAALLPLDACALGGLDPATGVRSGPHLCRAGIGGPRDALLVEVGSHVDRVFSSGRETFVLDGVQAARHKSYNGCDVYVLVGADLGITHSKADKGERACEEPTTAARATIAALRDPAAVSRAEPRPDTCDLLKRVAGDRLAGLSTRYSRNLGQCQSSRELTKERDGGDGWEAVYLLGIRYGVHGSIEPDEPVVLAGRQAMRYDGGDRCEYTWRTGPSGRPQPEYADQLMMVRAPGCDDAAELATAAMAVETSAPAKVDPQRPVTIPA
ncbi:hypothetical protein ABZ816_32015 [Actinosynnema sp. NPDC047251]|uniref:Putative secreted protein n=1 Tax=Saccharothrix espanaensis (strain ATCC 51144 / DSM 44229 / JCM 9112 / NBRC 15066 / NRRL 15764) TaxID=1179773 RepID=K0K0B9_SACES|nr:hypothetical protein [Saccharothrix espanaensis]CCH29993.1 putative secreted protein [Saccharothrix espanaensis DSM 44229]